MSFGMPPNARICSRTRRPHLAQKNVTSHEDFHSEFCFVLIPRVRLAPISLVDHKYMGMSFIVAPDAFVLEDVVDVNPTHVITFIVLSFGLVISTPVWSRRHLLSSGADTILVGIKAVVGEPDSSHRTPPHYTTRSYRSSSQ